MKRERRLTRREVREQLARTDVVEVNFPCPSCGALAGSKDTDPPTVFHPLPMCDRFIAIQTVADAADYMRESRAKHYPETFS